MADRSVATTDTVNTFRTTFNSLATDVGDINNLNVGSATDLVEAVNTAFTTNNNIFIGDDSSTTLAINSGETIRFVSGSGVNAVASSTIAGSMDGITFSVDTSVVATADSSITFTNKSINLANNTVTTTLALLNTAVSDATLVDLDDAQTLTNKVMSGSSNTFSNIPVSALASPSITVGDESSNTIDVSLGGEFSIVGGAGVDTAISNNLITISGFDKTANNTFGKAQRGSVGTNSTATGSVTLDFDTNQHFLLTATGNITLANPSTEAVGQSGVIVITQDGTGNRTLSLGTDYETAGGDGITLSTAASAVDLIPYFVKASNSIQLGAVQQAFS